MSNIILGTIDAGGEGQAVLLAAVNAKLGLALTANDVVFAEPDLVSTPSPTHNSVIKMIPYASSGLYGTRRVFYNRIHVSDLGVISVPRASAVNVSDLLVDISYKYGILIKPEDIFDAVLPAPVQGNPNVEINLVFRPTSVIYYGEVKIILGNNDPSGGNTGGSTLFVPVQTIFGWDAEEVSTGVQKVDIFSTTIDQDKSRKRTAQVIGTESSIGNILKRTWPSDALALAVEGHGFPLVGSWTTSTGAVRVVDCYGAVLEKDATSTGWGTTVGMLGGLQDDDDASISVTQYNMPIKGVVQGIDRKLYALVVTTDTIGNNPVILMSEDDGSQWVVVDDLNAALSSDILGGPIWDDPMEIKDFIYHNNKLWFLYRIKGVTNYAIESIDLTSKLSTSYTLVSAVRGSATEVVNRDSDKFAFSIPVSTMITPNVVGVAHAATSFQPQVWLYTAEGANYVPNAVNTTLLDHDFLTNPYTYVSGHSQEIVKNALWHLDVIEMGTSVASDDVNTEFASMNAVRTLSRYKTYGVMALTSIASGANRTKWVQSDVKLGASDYPRPMRLQSLGRYAVFHLQPENSLVRLRFTEDSVVGGFAATADNSIIIEKTSQYRKVLPFGSAAYTKPSVTESTFMNYLFLTGSDTETAKPDIYYSFIGKNATTAQWLTAATANTPFLKRTMGFSNIHMGEVPLAVGNMDDRLVYLSASQQIYTSANIGKSWTVFSDARSFYQDGGVTDNRSIASYAAVPLLSTSVKSGTLMNDTLVFEIDHTVTGLVFDKRLKDLAASRVFTTHTLLSVSISDLIESTGYVPKGAYASYGMNFAGANQPSRIEYWRTDFSNNQAFAMVKYTEDDLAILAETNDSVNALVVPPAGWSIMDVKKDVLYLDIKEATIAKSAGDVYGLFIMDKNDAQYEIPLFGGSKPANAGFKPDVSFYLWDYQDANYVPLVYYTDKAVLVIDRLVESGLFADRLFLLTVPGDNGATLRPIPMINKNRREYWFHQKGNGIFTLHYVYNPLNRNVTMSLVRQFTMTDPGLNDIDIHTGMAYGKNVALPPDTPLIPVFPANGTLINEFCDGLDKKGNYNDGAGGQYIDVIEVNSVDCGYVPPVPGPVAAPTAVLTVNTDTNGVVHTETTTGEDGSAYVVYAFSNPLIADTDLVVDLAHVTTSGGDFSAFDWRYDEESWNTLSMGTPITVPAGAESVTVRVTYVEDTATEGTETYVLVMDKAPGNTQITSAEIETTITINDTSTAAPTTASITKRTSGLPGPSGDSVSTEVNEGEWLTLIYDLSNPLPFDVSDAIQLDITSAEAGYGDLENVRIWNNATGAWGPFSLNSFVTIRAGETVVTVGVKLYPDDTIEGEEQMTLVMSVNQSGTSITGTDMTNIVTVNDTSNGLSGGPAAITLNTTGPGAAGMWTETISGSEGNYVHLVYDITPTLSIDINDLTLNVTGPGDADEDDVDVVEIYNSGNSTWSNCTLGVPLFVAAAQPNFTIRVKLKEDFSPEALEQLTLTLSVAPSSTQVTTGDIVHTVGIEAN